MTTLAKDPGRDLRLTRRQRRLKKVLCNWQLYLFLLPALAYFIVMRYVPMLGLQIAFRKYKASEGIWGSTWVGMKYFDQFFKGPNFVRLLTNTLMISVGSLLLSFPVPVILALLLNQMPSKKYKKLVQTTIYAPHFISTVVLVGMIFLFFSPRNGIVNHLIAALGGERIHFTGEPSWFRPLYIGSDIWQNAGWGSIIYLAALSGINPELHEAAIMDGANKYQRVWHIDLPGILPTVVIMFILSAGRVMTVGFDKAYLMQTSLNKSTAEIIAVHVYQRGLLENQPSYSTAVGMFESVVNLVLILTVNFISKKVSDSSLF